MRFLPQKSCRLRILPDAGHQQRIFAKSAAKCGRISLGAGFFDASGAHTAVFAADQHSDVPGSGYFLYDIGDVSSDSFLELKAPGNHIRDSCDFAEADDSGTAGAIEL